MSTWMVVLITIACVFGTSTVALVWLLWMLRGYLVVWDDDDEETRP